jgi:L-rhamnose mutarotase
MAPVSRYASIIGLKPDEIARYKKLHKAVWSGVLKMIKDCHIRNYSIFLREIEPGKFYLFSYLEYEGTDYAADTARMAADPVTQEWWKITDPIQTLVPVREPGEKWARMEEVFHID